MGEGKREFEVEDGCGGDGFGVDVSASYLAVRIRLKKRGC